MIHQKAGGSLIIGYIWHERGEDRVRQENSTSPLVTTDSLTYQIEMLLLSLRRLQGEAGQHLGLVHKQLLSNFPLKKNAAFEN